jgi:Tfp pilus assembly protein PilW
LIVRNERGVSLVEVLVALVLTGAVLVMVYGSFYRTKNAAQKMTSVIEGRENARTAIQLLERELRMAGSGWGRQSVHGIYNGVRDTFYAVNPGYGGSISANDSVFVLGAWDAATTLRASMANPSAVIRVVNTAGFNTGDFCVVTNGDRAHLFQVTSKTTSPHNLNHATSSPYNTNGTLNSWPAGGYGTGAQVYRVSWVSYLVDSTTFGRPALIRREANRTAQLLAPNAERFVISYVLQDGSTTRNPRNPVDLPFIDQLVPVVRTTLLQGSTVVLDSAWANVRPRTF